MAGRKIEVDVVGNASGFFKTIDGVTAKLNMFKSAGLKEVGKGVAIGAGIGAFNLLTSAIDIGISKMDEMHQAFLDDEASQARLQNALKNTVKNYGAAFKAAEDLAGRRLRAKASWRR